MRAGHPPKRGADDAAPRLLAGLLTVAAPCTLPVLPILLGGSIGRSGGLRPVFIASGFVASFAATVLTRSAEGDYGTIDRTIRTLLDAES